MLIYHGCYQRMAYTKWETELDGVQKLFQSEQPGQVSGLMEGMSIASLQHSLATAAPLSREPHLHPSLQRVMLLGSGLQLYHLHIHGQLPHGAPYCDRVTYTDTG